MKVNVTWSSIATDQSKHFVESSFHSSKHLIKTSKREVQGNVSATNENFCKELLSTCHSVSMLSCVHEAICTSQQHLGQLNFDNERFGRNFLLEINLS